MLVYSTRIKHCIWPHKHGGKGTRGKRGKQDSFAFDCILLNIFNAYCDINGIADVDYDYYSFREQVSDQLYMYARGLSDAK